VKILKQVAGEELVHAGGFLRLLRALEPGEEVLYAEGATESEGTIKKMKWRIPLKNSAPVMASVAA
jgi:rubrerythrin